MADECALCGLDPAPHTVGIAGMNLTCQICQDCYDSLKLGEFSYYQLLVIDDQEVLFEIVP